MKQEISRFQRRLNRIFKWVVAALGVYLFLLGWLYFFQRQFIYFPTRGNISPAAWQLPSVKMIQLITRDHVKLTGWFHPPQKHMPTLVYFVGNSGHIGFRAARIRGFVQAGFGVLIVSYRGYAGSEGKPSEQGLYEDARTAMRFLKNQAISLHCIILFGESLGTGVAVQMATEFPVGALVLQSAYPSLSEVAAIHYPLFPVSYLLKDRFNSQQKISTISVPVLFIHGEDDRLIPFTLGKKLFYAANQPKEMIVYAKTGHNDLPEVVDPVVRFSKKYIICSA